MANYLKIHGLTLAGGAAIQNAVIESLSSDPVPSYPGQIWFNLTSKEFKYSGLDAGGAIEINVFGSAQDLANYVSSLSSSTGASLLGYDGATGSNGQFSLAASAADVALDSLVSGLDQEIQDRIDAILALTNSTSTATGNVQSELDATQSGAGLNTDGTYTAPAGSNYLTGATDLENATVLLDTQAKTNADGVAASLPLVGGTMTGDIQLGSNEIFTSTSPSTAGALVNKAYADSIAAGFDPKESTRVATTANIDLATGGLLTVDGVVLIAGDRVLVKNQTDATENGIYDVVAGTWTRSTDMDGTPAAEVSGGANTYVEQGTINEGAGFVLIWDGIVALGTDDINWTQSSGTGAVAGIQTEIDTIEAGAGLGGDGTYSISGTNYIDTATSLKNADVLLDTQAKANADAVTTEITNRAAADTLINTELDTTQTGAGLAANGTYTTNTGTNYLDTATSLDNADDLLDAALKAVSDSVTGDASAIQAELDATQLNAGLDVNGNYVANGSANYIALATTFQNADNLLDSQLKTVTDGLSTEVTDRGLAVTAEATARTNADIAINNELTATQTGAGLANDGTYTTNSGTNYLDTATSLDSADDLLDAALAALATTVGGGTNALQLELDATQTGAGLGTGGTYTATGAANYISGATDLDNADQLLDAQVKVNADAIGAETTARTNADTTINSELTDTQVGAGLAANGNYVVDGTADYISAATSLSNADSLLDDQIKVNTDAIGANATAYAAADTLIQNELNLTQTGAGLSATGAYVANGSANYINTATSLTDADDLLDAQVKTNTDDINDRLQLAGGIMTGNITMGVYEVYTTTSPTSPSALVNKAYADSIAAGFDPKESTRVATTADLATAYNNGTAGVGATLTSSSTEVIPTFDGQTVVVGNRILVKDQTDPVENGIYTVTDEGSAGTNWVLTRALDMDGSPAAEVSGGVHTYVEIGTNNAGGEFVILFDGNVTLGTDDVTWTQSGGQGALTGLQGELDITQAGAGLGTNGAYTANGGANYISSATSLDNADQLLDAQIDTNETNITGLQTEMDATQLGAGLSVTGTYVADGGADYISGAVSLSNADSLLDDQIKTNADAIVTEAAARVANHVTINSDITAIETGAGLQANGTYLATGAANYISGATDLDNADQLLDAQAKVNADAIGAETTARTNADSTMQSELDATQSGAGLGTGGAYIATGGSNYLSGATDLDNADQLLDTQVKANADAIGTSTTAYIAADTLIRSDYNARTYTQETTVAAQQHTITHNLNNAFLNVTIWTKNGSGTFQNDIVLITETNANVLTIDCTEAVNIKIIITSALDL